MKKGYITTRSLWKAVKGYDHAHFDMFLTEVYKEGIKDGRESTPGTDIEDILKKIREVRGIGPKRIAAIREAVDTLFQKSEQEDKT